MSRRCGNCGEPGHNRQTCQKPTAERRAEIDRQQRGIFLTPDKKAFQKPAVPVVATRGDTDNRTIDGVRSAEHNAPSSELSKSLGFDTRDTKLLGLVGGTRQPPGDTRTVDLTGDHATALDDVLLYRMPVVARIADRLKRMVRRDHPTDVMLVALVDVLNESVELGAIRSRTLYCQLTQTALKERWVEQAPARGIRP